MAKRIKIVPVSASLFSEPEIKVIYNIILTIADKEEIITVAKIEPEIVVKPSVQMSEEERRKRFPNAKPMTLKELKARKGRL